MRRRGPMRGSRWSRGVPATGVFACLPPLSTELGERGEEGREERELGRHMRLVCLPCCLIVPVGQLGLVGLAGVWSVNRWSLACWSVACRWCEGIVARVWCLPLRWWRLVVFPRLEGGGSLRSGSLDSELSSSPCSVVRSVVKSEIGLCCWHRLVEVAYLIVIVGRSPRCCV